jgi:DNA-directed RNA polymerase alpha subunit
LRGNNDLGVWGRQLVQNVNASNKRKKDNGKKGSVVKVNKGYSVGVRAVARKTLVHCVNVLLKQQPFSDRQYNFKVRQNVATNALNRVANQLGTISELVDISKSNDVDDMAMQQALAEVTNKLNEIAGIKFRYVPTEKLAICASEPIENLDLPKRVVTILMTNEITTIGSLFLKFTTTSILGVSGIGEMALKSIKTSLVNQGFILDMRRSLDG